MSGVILRNDISHILSVPPDRQPLEAEIVQVAISAITPGKSEVQIAGASFENRV